MTKAQLIQELERKQSLIAHLDKAFIDQVDKLRALNNTITQLNNTINELNNKINTLSAENDKLDKVLKSTASALYERVR